MSVKIRCRDLLALEHPEFVDENVAGKCVGCPSSYGYTKDNPEWCMFALFEPIVAYVGVKKLMMNKLKKLVL